MKSAVKQEPRARDQTCGLYAHIPFCESKCGYCDFYSVPVGGRDPGPLVDRIGRELSTRLAGGGYVARTIFCGGGTPTVLVPDDLGTLLKALSRSAQNDELVEFTVEANPATVDDAKAELLLAAGVNRVSMGAQSFLGAELATLERLHSPEDIPPSVATLRRHGVPQVSLDLIFGIPGQTLAAWGQTLRRALDLEPDHIACYGLTYEPGTRLEARRQAGQLVPCAEQLEADMYLLAMETLEKAGYEQYEISNYARPGGQCVHNLMYWQNRPYVGVGPSAVGCIDGRRYRNVADVDGYIALMDERGHAEADFETIDREKLVTEMIMMQMRLAEGLSIASFQERIGADPLIMFDAVLPHLIDLDLLKVSDTHIALTPPGRLVADAVISELAGAYGGLEGIC